MLAILFVACQVLFSVSALAYPRYDYAVVFGAAVLFEVWAGVALWRRPIDPPPGGSGPAE